MSKRQLDSPLIPASTRVLTEAMAPELLEEMGDMLINVREAGKWFDRAMQGAVIGSLNPAGTRLWLLSVTFTSDDKVADILIRRFDGDNMYRAAERYWPQGMTTEYFNVLGNRDGTVTVASATSDKPLTRQERLDLRGRSLIPTRTLRNDTIPTWITVVRTSDRDVAFNEWFAIAIDNGIENAGYYLTGVPLPSHWTPVNPLLSKNAIEQAKDVIGAATNETSSLAVWLWMLGHNYDFASVDADEGPWVNDAEAFRPFSWHYGATLPPRDELLGALSRIYALL